MLVSIPPSVKDGEMTVNGAAAADAPPAAAAKAEKASKKRVGVVFIGRSHFLSQETEISLLLK